MAMMAWLTNHTDAIVAGINCHRLNEAKWLNWRWNDQIYHVESWLAILLIIKAAGPPVRFVSESSVYRILKKQGLVTTPAFRLMEAADESYNPTTATNQLWQTDFTARAAPLL
ncbi:hypothetical protein GCM10028774_64490 [Spirosoma jeollabukense]